MATEKKLRYIKFDIGVLHLELTSRCNALCPGGIYKDHDKRFVKKLSKLIPMNRMAKINEC